MSNHPYPTEPEIRAALVDRLRKFCAITGAAPSVVCRTVMNDTTFFSKIVGGGNFTVATYKRLQAHLDDNWPRPKRKAAKKKRNGSHQCRSKQIKRTSRGSATIRSRAVPRRS
jgi:hypothetical protein